MATQNTKIRKYCREPMPLFGGHIFEQLDQTSKVEIKLKLFHNPQQIDPQL